MVLRGMRKCLGGWGRSRGRVLWARSARWTESTRRPWSGARRECRTVCAGRGAAALMLRGPSLVAPPVEGGGGGEEGGREEKDWSQKRPGDLSVEILSRAN